ncbi:MAG: LysR family transcriptional regulator [Chlamydiae bacterium]|nr:LysR family transcriptional regulator [Chlamydiota bacterium]
MEINKTIELPYAFFITRGRMDLQLLETFLDLAETKNFTMTAKRLKKSQAAISLQINRLEELLGKFLFDRDNRNVNLSQDGEVLVSYAKQILNMHQELLYRFSALPIEGTVTIGATENFCATELPEILSLFTKQYPKIILKAYSDSAKNLKTLFEKEGVEMIIFEQLSSNPIAESIPLKEESLVWIKGKDFHVDFSKPIPIILGPEGCTYREKTIEALDDAKIPYRIIFSSASQTGRLSAVKTGLGISILPTSQLKKEFEVLEQAPLPKLPKLQISMLKSKKISLAQEALSDHIFMQFQG